MKIHAIVLTKSAMNKNGKKGACTTAYDTLNQRIIRLVSDKKGSPLPYSISDTFELFDIVEADVIDLCPDGPQSENVYVNISSVAVKGQYEGSKETLLAEIAELYHGDMRFMDDTSPKIMSVSNYGHSLEIIKVENLVIKQINGFRKSGKVSFTHDDKFYSYFSITDNDYDIRGKDFSEWDVGEAYIAVSIPTIPFVNDGAFYKFVAAIYPITDIIKVHTKEIEYGNSARDNLTYTASYTGKSKSFTVSGLPESDCGADVLQHSFTCVIRNILSRSAVVEPSEYLKENINKVIGDIKIRDAAYDAIIRYQFAVLALTENGFLNLEDSIWKFNVKDKNVFKLAAEDLLLWFENLYCLAGTAFNRPSLLFSNEADAIKIENCFESKVAEKHSVSIIESDISDNYHVSCGKSVNYNIEPKISENKKQAMLFLLKNIFGYDDFNQGQLQIITNILNRKKTIGILPTGGGKSLCYQYAAILQPGVSFSVCPLVSLIQDQKDNLDEQGFKRTNFIISDQKDEKQTIQDNFADGKYQLIWISPERFQSEEFRACLASLHNVSYAVIDEVHCLSEWGHDFRTSYLALVPTIENMCPEATLVGLTATASQAVLKDLKLEFNIDNYGVRALPSLQRENLTMHVIKTEDKMSALEKLIGDGEMVNDSSTGIIFTLFKDKSGDPDQKPYNFALLDRLKKMRPDLKTEKYHADIVNKREVQNRFKNGDINILSSTKAFGMGINKDDIRFTIHNNLPWSVESFYQEAGRAGRGQNKISADCYILYTPEDPSIHQITLKLFERDTTPEEIINIQKKYRACLNDVGSIFFLWGLNNQGVEKDIQDISATIEKLRNAKKADDEKGKIYCEIEPDWSLKRDKLELAIYRLKLLGRVTDWTIQWRKGVPIFKCYLADDYSIENAKAAMFRYIRRYDPTFGEPWTSETKKYEQTMNDESMTELRRYATVLLEWSYDHIVYSRRRMIYNIKDFCESYTDPLSFRKRIDDFLRISDSNVVLEGIVDNPANWEPWFDIFMESETIDGEHKTSFVSHDGCEALRETTARYLESYKNITGLNLIYCLSGALCGRYSVEMDHELMVSVVEDISEKYKEKAIIIEKILEFLSTHSSDMDVSALKDIADCISEEYPEQAEYCYKHYHNNHALTIMMNRATGRIRKIMRRHIK